MPEPKMLHTDCDCCEHAQSELSRLKAELAEAKSDKAVAEADEKIEAGVRAIMEAEVRRLTAMLEKAKGALRPFANAGGFVLNTTQDDLHLAQQTLSELGGGPSLPSKTSGGNGGPTA